MGVEGGSSARVGVLASPWRAALALAVDAVTAFFLLHADHDASLAERYSFVEARVTDVIRRSTPITSA